MDSQARLKMGIKKATTVVDIRKHLQTKFLLSPEKSCTECVDLVRVPCYVPLP